MPPVDDCTLSELAHFAGDPWRENRPYYDQAEAGIDNRWKYMILPFIHGMDFKICVDLAAGHGRNTRKLLEQPNCEKIFVVDINEENVRFCRQRFASESRVEYVQNNGYSLHAISTGEITCFYCFDAMVHFDSDVVRAYLKEIHRVLHPSRGMAFLHHSNYPLPAAEALYDMSNKRHGRNFMTAELFQHYAYKEGLELVRQQKIDWLHDQSFIDCFSLVRVR